MSKTVPPPSRRLALASGSAVTTPRSEDAAGTVLASFGRLFIPDFATLPNKKCETRLMVHCVVGRGVLTAPQPPHNVKIRFLTVSARWGHRALPSFVTHGPNRIYILPRKYASSLAMRTTALLTLLIMWQSLGLHTSKTVPPPSRRLALARAAHEQNRTAAVSAAGAGKGWTDLSAVTAPAAETAAVR